MSFLVDLLLVIVSLVGAFVVGRVVEKFVSASPDANWEYMLVVLIGAGLLIWPVARQASLRGAERKLAQYRQILELQDLESYRLVKTGSGETLDIVEDQESGEIRLKAAKASEPKAPEAAKTPGEPPPPAPPQVK
jgi:hypothetical protein